MPEGLAPAYKPLFELAGPVIRYRIMRDLAHRDDSFLENLGLRQEVEKQPFVQAILPQRKADGSWGEWTSSSSATSIEETILMLCELGLSDHDAVSQYAQANLLPRLSQECERNSLEELPNARPPDTTVAPKLGKFARDGALRLLVRAGFGGNPQVRQAMSDVIREWKDFLREAMKAVQPREGIFLPTGKAYDAICFHEWQSDEEETVAEIVTNLFVWAEEASWPEQLLAKQPYGENVFRLFSKQEYLARPERMLYELELSARLGIAQKTAVTRWMLEELEARQDGDGFFRFDFGGPSSLPWYFPLERDATAADFITDWTFRGSLIFSLVGYDV